VECRREVPAQGGGSITAIEIQRRYLHHAEAHADAPYMPPWTRVVCERWGDVLDRLADGPARVADRLDWGIKLAMYRDRAERRGFAWHTLAEWSALARERELTRLARRGVPSPIEALLGIEMEQQRTADPEPPEATPDQPGDRLDAFIVLRNELLEIDTRWGQLGPEGLFDALDRTGVLDHGVGVEGIEEAMEHPPDGSRAQVRGAAILRLAPHGDRYTAGWDHIFDHETGRRLDLSNPFADAELWRMPRPAPGTGQEPAPTDQLPPVDDRLWEGFSRIWARVRRGRARDV
jgi:hypothetical protein